MEVVFFQRKPRSDTDFSVEFIFDAVRALLKENISSRVEYSRYTSNGLFKRLAITFYAAFKQGEVNHVTGDISFINLFFRKKSSVLTILDCGFMTTSSGFRRFILKTVWLTIPVSRAQIVTVISQATKDDLLQYVDCEPDKIRVVPVFVSERFVPGEGKAFNSNKPVLLQVGTTANKNLPRLIEAIKDLNCSLDIVGSLTDEYKEVLAKYNVDYTNSVRISNEEILAKYQNCDIVTFVSTFEGFGMPIIEANCVEKPVITSNLLSMPEVAGDAACLVDPYNIGEITAGINKIINDESYRISLVENGKTNKLRYQAKAIAQLYADVYHEIVK